LRKSKKVVWGNLSGNPHHSDAEETHPETDPDTLSLTPLGCNVEKLSQGTSLISQLVDDHIRTHHPYMSAYPETHHRKSEAIITSFRASQTNTPNQLPDPSTSASTTSNESNTARSIKYLVYDNRDTHLTSTPTIASA